VVRIHEIILIFIEDDARVLTLAARDTLSRMFDESSPKHKECRNVIEWIGYYWNEGHNG
jgi:hypothetical protein